MQSAYLNGTYLPAAEARISPLDRGFLLGDGAFETIRVIQGHPYLLDDHLARLRTTLHSIGLPFSTAPLHDVCRQLIMRNAMTDGILRITVSRGEGGAGYAPPATPTPTVFIHARPLGLVPDTTTARLSTWRKVPPACLPTEGKTLQALNAILARLESPQDGESLQLDMQGHLASFSSGNLFWHRENTWYTPALSTGCLAGITRRRLLQLSPSPIQEVEAPLASLHGADAVVLTNSRVLAMGVTALSDLGLTFPQSHTMAQNWRALLESDATTTV
jgi:branched-subunit amino acid aminotransferase/4-amino-4-deoxychorismate lyase